MKVNIAVIGASGYSGLELVRLLSSHPKIKITALTSEKFARQPYDQVFPSLFPFSGIILEPLNPEKIAKKADFIFTALPHKEAMEVIPFFISAGKKVVDLSADFRFKDCSVYEQWYQKHTAASLLKRSVYGLTEINRAQIKKAALVANPGCYPTSVLIPLYPLIKEGLISSQHIIIDAKSGVSGAGRSLNISSLFCEASESFKAYNVTKHRHQPEIEEQLSIYAKQPVQVTFVPHLVPMNRGILSTIYVTLRRDSPVQFIINTVNQYYGKEQFIRIFPEGILPQSGWVRGSNYCDVGLTKAHGNRLIIISTIDNLVKGAAGQAVQNMNLMLGFKENIALEQKPLYP
jgi:N-acetyl-gamma-glutamyl-phosphate reductase